MHARFIAPAYALHVGQYPARRSALHSTGMRLTAATLLVLPLVIGCSGGAAKTRGGGASDGKAAAPAITGVPRIWVLAVGVSNYKEKSLALEYADRDAGAIDAFFAGEAGGRVPDERRVLLVNQNATRPR